MNRYMKKTKIILLALTFMAVAIFASACAVDESYGAVQGGAGAGAPQIVEETPEPEEAPSQDDDVLIEDLEVPDYDVELEIDYDAIFGADEPEDDFVFGDIPEFLSITGTVESILSATPEADEDDPWHGISVSIIDENGVEAVINTNANTAFPFGNEIQEGDTITAWYATNMPMIMIWPPQYTATALAVNIPDGTNIKVDRFEAMADTDQLLSEDGMFAFRTDENTKIILADGTDFTDGDLEGRRIVVIYGMSTRSIPEQATATKLIVLFEDIVPLG